MKFLIPLLVCIWAGVLPAHGQTLRLNSGVGAPYFQDNKQGFLDLLIPEVFRRLGVDAEAVRYVAATERAMLNANVGIDDGVALRIRGLEKSYPNLMLIDEKIIDNDFIAYSLRHELATTSFEVLVPYTVGYINGWKIFEARLLPGTVATKVQDPEQLFNLLVNDRADLILYERWQGNQIIHERNLKARALQPPLASSEMFMYLHSKHAALLEPAARALRAMKADGSYQRIAAKTLPGYSGK